MRGRGTAAFVLAVLLAFLGTACAAKPGAEEAGGTVVLTVSREKAAPLLRESVRIVPGETVLELLARRRKVETAYGGGFVSAIDGIRSTAGPPHRDWFYSVNGVEANHGAGETLVRDGDRIEWTYRAWGPGDV